MYEDRKRLYVVRMMYNAAFEQRTTRGRLIDEVGIDAPHWDVVPLTNTQFAHMAQLGGVDETLIVD
jgi:hypothetical protein